MRDNNKSMPLLPQVFKNGQDFPDFVSGRKKLGKKDSEFYNN